LYLKKNNYLIIPNRVIRDALIYCTFYLKKSI